MRSENERVREHNRREQIRRDPALDGLRAEDKVEPERAPLSRMRKLAYTALALVLVVALYIAWYFSLRCWRLRRLRCGVPL